MDRILVLFALVSVLAGRIHTATITEDQREDIRALIDELMESEKRDDEDITSFDMRGGVPSFGDTASLEPTALNLGRDLDFTKRADKEPIIGFGKKENLESEKRGDDEMMMSFGGRDLPSFGDVPNLEPQSLNLGRGLEMEKKGQSYEINMCYFCDTTCVTTLGMPANQVLNYMSDVTAGIQRRLATLMGSGVTVNRYGYLLQFPMPAQTYLLFKSGSFNGKGLELLSHIAQNFWANWKPAQIKKALNEFLVQNGCDINFLMVSSYDDVWTDQFAGQIAGEAITMGICTGHAFGMVKLNKDTEAMASLLAHEVGHTLGLYHDGALSPLWVNACAQFPGFPTCADLKAKCTAGNSQCADGEGNCIMNPRIGPNDVQYSECSKAYWAGFVEMASIPGLPYSLDCIKQ